MKKFVYIVGFVDSSRMEFESTDEIDFHKLQIGTIAFPEVFINMANVTYITKKEKNQDV